MHPALDNRATPLQQLHAPRGNPSNHPAPIPGQPKTCVVPIFTATIALFYLLHLLHELAPDSRCAMDTSNAQHPTRIIPGTTDRPRHPNCQRETRSRPRAEHRCSLVPALLRENGDRSATHFSRPRKNGQRFSIFPKSVLREAPPESAERRPDPATDPQDRSDETPPG